jgi:colanic acid/amylovoran biosynthesis protein
MKKVLLTGTYCSLNKGDAAMETSTANAISNAIPNCKVTICSPFSKYDKEYYKPIPVEHCYRRRLIYASFLLLRLSIWRFFRSFVKSDLKFLVTHPELQLFFENDLIVDLSGDMLTEDYGVHVAYSHYIPLLMAILADKPIFICAQSIGPFKWTKPIARFILNRSIVTVRESISYDYLKTISLTNTKVSLTADMAFLLEPSSDDEVNEILINENFLIEGKRLLGVSLSRIVEKKFNSENTSSKSLKFKETIAQTLDKICIKHNLTPIFIPHVTGPSKAKNDRLINNEVLDIMTSKGFVIQGDYTSSQLKGIIRQCFCFVGARMHANIGALSNSVPVVAISYSHKTPGIMKMLGQEQMVCDVLSFNKSELEEKIEIMITNRDMISATLSKHLINVKDAANKNVKIIEELLLNKIN